MPSDTKLDCELILGLHRGIFGELFHWGGSYRTIDVIVVGKQQFKTPPPQIVPTVMVQFESDLQEIQMFLANNCSPNDPIYWRTFAEVYFKFCEIHPFRDGNGRVSRLLLTILIYQTLEEPILFDWYFLNHNQPRTNKAFEAARLNNDLWPLARLIYKVICLNAKHLNKNPPNCKFGGRGSLRKMRD